LIQVNKIEAVHRYLGCGELSRSGICDDPRNLAVMVGFYHRTRPDFRSSLFDRTLAFTDELDACHLPGSGARSTKAVRRFVRGDPAFAFATG